jgi:hypothetical protein
MSLVTPTTKLEAVNTMLRAIGESPTSTLSGDVGVDVVTARQTLDEVTKAVQAEGWLFNTEHAYPLSRDSENNIVIPATALSVGVDRRKYFDIDAVLRGNRLYDRKNHTYVFDRDLEAKIVFGLDFEEMPETARTYVTYRAARKFQDTSLGSQELHQFNEKDELYARIRFMDDQAEDEDLNFLKDDPAFQPLWSY